MLSATIGSADVPVDTHIDTLTDTFLIVPPAPPTPEQLTQPIDIASASTSGAANGDGEPTGSSLDLGRPQRALSPDQPPKPLGWVVSNVVAVLQPTRTDFEVTTKIGNDGDPAHFFVHGPAMSDATTKDIGHVLAQYAAEITVRHENPWLQVQSMDDLGDWNNYLDLSQSKQPDKNPHPGEMNTSGSKFYADDAERYLGQFQSSAAAEDESLADSTSISLAQRSHDSAFQEYTTQLRPLLFDQSAAAGINSLSLADTHGNLDDAEGGFVALDGSVATDADLAQRTEADVASAAIDAAIANLTGFGWSANGGAAVDQSSSANSQAGDTSALAGENSALVDASGQGGMVLLDSTADNGGDSISLAAAREVPVDMSMPTASGKLEASVGIYQAFDVATADATTAAAPTAAATSTITPAANHEHDAKNHVSADKVSKPATDQASTWVEMFTAAAVIGATKKRKSRTMS
jgi:hypothetical protein